MKVYVYLYGRLGNNLAQIGAAATLSARLGCDFVAVPNAAYWCPEPDYCYLPEYLRPLRDTIFHDIHFDENLPHDVIELNDGGLENIEDLSTLRRAGKDILLNDYFLNMRFLDRTLCRNLFSLPTVILDELREKYRITDSTGTIVVRRGDYVQLPHQFALCGTHYYKKAMAALEAQHTIDRWLVITDDIEWCRRKFQDSTKYIIVEEPPLVDLFLPTLCKYNIISNSTFAWWGAFLNPHADQSVAYPAPWYGVAFRKKEKSVRLFCNQPHWHPIANRNLYHSCRGVVHYLYGAIRKYVKLLTAKHT